MKKKLENSIRKIKQKIKQFINDEYGGNLVEYALLIGFALFVFFIIVGVITSLLDWTLGLSNDFFDIFGGLGG
jgi:Flp pilus assembly pilin Flp